MTLAVASVEPLLATINSQATLVFIASKRLRHARNCSARFLVAMTTDTNISKSLAAPRAPRNKNGREAALIRTVRNIDESPRWEHTMGLYKKPSYPRSSNWQVFIG